MEIDIVLLSTNFIEQIKRIGKKVLAIYKLDIIMEIQKKELYVRLDLKIKYNP